MENTTSGSGVWLSCLNDGKISKKIYTTISRKLQVKLQGVKLQQKQSSFKCYCKPCPQDLTKWYSRGSTTKTIKYVLFIKDMHHNDFHLLLIAYLSRQIELTLKISSLNAFQFILVKLQYYDEYCLISLGATWV